MQDLDQQELLNQLNEQQRVIEQQTLIIQALKMKIANLVTQSAIDEYNIQAELEQMRQNGQGPQVPAGLQAVPDAGAEADNVSPSGGPDTSKTKAPD